MDRSLEQETILFDLGDAKIETKGPPMDINNDHVYLSRSSTSGLSDE